ncbi:MAG: hypothetical protein ABWY83_06395 [Actinomycetota bacterium]
MAHVNAFVEICNHDERFFACPICWPVLPEEEAAFSGLTGEFVRSFVLSSEADPFALAGTFLTLAGNRFGPRAHAKVGAGAHPGRLFFVAVGETSVARKGVSFAETSSVYEAALPGWYEGYVFKGFGSGEALIARVAERMNTGQGNVEAIHDPRVVVHESEFSSLLRVASRDGSILSGIVRDAWDGISLQNNVKRERIVAPPGHMVSLVAHVTADELRREMTRTDIANGFANRFLFAKVRRTRRIAHPETVDPTEVAAKLKEVIARAAGVGEMRFTQVGADTWTLAYEALEDAADSSAGLVAPLLARGSAQTLRLAVVYALLDGSSLITAEHIESALAFWFRCSRGIQDIFGDATGNPIADRIAAAIDVSEDGLSREEVSAVLGRNRSKPQIDAAIDVLVASGRYVQEQRSTGGRPAAVLARRVSYEGTNEGAW